MAWIKPSKKDMAVTFSYSRCVLACLACPIFRRAAALVRVSPVLAGWSSGVPSGGPVVCAVWLGGLAVSCVWAVLWLWAFLVPPPPWYSFFGRGRGLCLFIPLPSPGWCTHWSALGVVNWVAVGAVVLLGLAPAPWVGWVMYTLGSVALLARLGSGSAGWAVAPGGFVGPWVRGAGVSCVSPPLRCWYYPSGGGLCGRTAAVVAGRAVAPCRCIVGCCGAFRGLRRLGRVRPWVSVPCSGVVVCCGAPCWPMLCFGAPCYVVPCCAVSCRGVLRCAVSRPVVLWCVVSWGALSWCVARWHAAVWCALLPRVVPWWFCGG